VFYMDVAKVDHDVIYVGNGYTYMLRASVLNISSIFSDIRCKCVYLDVVYVSHIYCKCFLFGCCMCFCNGFSSVFRFFYKCFRRMFQVFHLSLDICCKCPIYMF
jgi:hypothetical protein